MKSKVDLIVFLGVLVSLYKVYLCFWWYLCFGNLGRNCVNMGFPCDIFINKLSAQYVCHSVSVVFLGVVLLSCHSAALRMFHYSVVFRLFRQCSGVPPAFRCSACVPCFVVPCSGVPGFIVCPRNQRNSDDFRGIRS